jgi:hypothetical protein
MVAGGAVTIVPVLELTKYVIRLRRVDDEHE